MVSYDQDRCRSKYLDQPICARNVGRQSVKRLMQNTPKAKTALLQIADRGAAAYTWCGGTYPKPRSTRWLALC